MRVNVFHALSRTTYVLRTLCLLVNKQLVHGSAAKYVGTGIPALILEAIAKSMPPIFFLSLTSIQRTMVLHSLIFLSSDKM